MSDILVKKLMSDMNKLKEEQQIKKDLMKFYILAAKNGFKEGNPIVEILRNKQTV